MSFRVSVIVEELNDAGTVMNTTSMERGILEDSWAENAEQWAAIMDAALVATYEYRPGVTIKAIDNE